MTPLARITKEQEMQYSKEKKRAEQIHKDIKEGKYKTDTFVKVREILLKE
jgi:anti-sigma28 factor (negative regulator of flagellin synthesis)